MKCIYCDGETQVTNSRQRKKDHQTWRRRQCKLCHATVTSVETFDYSNAIKVKKRNGHFEAFERDKIFFSVYRAIDHLPNPIQTATHLSNTILRQILVQKPISPVIESTYIAKSVIKTLRNFNAASSVRYLSFQANLQLPNDVRRSLRA